MSKLDRMKACWNLLNSDGEKYFMNIRTGEKVDVVGLSWDKRNPLTSCIIVFHCKKDILLYDFIDLYKPVIRLNQHLQL